MTQQTIYLVRHGETEWNREGRMQGQLDSRLTPKGETQAQRIGELLAELVGEPERHVVAVSPLGRTRRTAAIICEALDLDPDACRINDLLKEKRYGAWEGKTVAEIAEADPEAWRQYRDDPWSVPPPGGESYAMLTVRARRWLAAASMHCLMIVVSHGAFGRALRGHYSGLTPEQTISQDVPQDALYRLSDGAVARIDA